jgi:NitT/TauT family transport system substrate-binding protein
MTVPKGRVTYDDLVPTLGDLSATQDDMIKYKLATAAVDIRVFLDDRFALAARRGQ